MHTVEDLENTLKDIFITTESTYNQQVELENLLEEVDPQSLIRTIWENSETIYSFRTEKNREQCMEYTASMSAPLQMFRHRKIRQRKNR